MARKNVAVYDTSSTYIKRFLKYVNHRTRSGYSVKGFSDLTALEEYLGKTMVDVLLFSMEEEMAKGVDAEPECAVYLDHPSVKKFVYFGERRNSKSKVTHIDKYQPAGNILSELEELLFSDEEEILPAEEAEKGSAELIAVFSPSPEEESVLCALEVAELLSVRKEVLFLDLERFSRFSQGEDGRRASLSDLIYVYKTNSKKLTECLKEKCVRWRTLDILTSPEEMEDMDEIREKDWPAFLRKICECGGYEIIVIHMAEAFRNPDYLFEASSKIYLPTSKSETSMQKMQRFADDCIGKGKQELYNKMMAVLTPSAREQMTETGEEEWNWLKN